ncbi:MAG: nicotinate-nucleotide diphosphorylase (carboxylating) [Campylobacteraceae bacterium 4484_4]|nr:MAG: nicotinate-nucleotide diphosphorylase (carboxylating) [Campylobacteraceae bacterium 4484_4]
MRIKETVREAILEDIGRGDLFSLVSDKRMVEAKIVAKEAGVFAGKIYVQELGEMEHLKIEFLVDDGTKIEKGDVLAYVRGEVNRVLMYERIILNLLQHCSGIATNTAKFVELVKDYNVKLLDTRKTRPGLRILEKYAVRCGGGTNHRLGLDDCLMLKDTHLATIDDLKQYIRIARKRIPYTAKIEIECENLDKVKEAMEAGADLIMCDNMSVEQVREVVAWRNANYPHVLLEASGNITMENIVEYAKTGVDAISSGSLIHKAVWLDFSMRIES